jgi:hypothetical protein
VKGTLKGAPSPSEVVLRDENAPSDAMPDPIIIAATCQRRSHGRWVPGLQSRLTNELKGDGRVELAPKRGALMRVYIAVEANRDEIKARIRKVIARYLGKFDRRKHHVEKRSRARARTHPLPRHLRPQHSCGGLLT